MQPPARNAMDVLDWIMSRHVHEYRDAVDRPVGEGRAAAFQQVETEMQSCPYAGSRYHHAKLMNVTALRQMPPWQDILTMLSWLSARYRAKFGTAIKTPDDLAAVTGAGIFLPDFLVLRQDKPLHSGELPILISGLYKVCLGFQLAYLRERFAAEASETPLPDAAGFYAYLEASELLIGDAEVCSGTPAMIMQAYDAIIGERSIALETLPPVCTRFEIAWDRFDDFTEHAAAIWRDLMLYAIETPRFCPRLSDPNLPPDLQRRLNARLEGRAKQILAAQTGLVVEIARTVAQGAELPSHNPIEAPSPPFEPAARQRSRGLAAVVIAWLGEAASSEMRLYEQDIARALEAQLARYDDYEASVLDELNRHVSALLAALGLDQRAAVLTGSALSLVCGRTLTDWRTPIR
jgi:hypothetical protein